MTFFKVKLFKQYLFLAPFLFAVRVCIRITKLQNVSAQNKTQKLRHTFLYNHHKKLPTRLFLSKTVIACMIHLHIYYHILPPPCFCMMIFLSLKPERKTQTHFSILLLLLFSPILFFITMLVQI